jgi:hypothetical protein
MKSEGFLDEIEKIVDEVWDVEKKQINTHVNSYKKAVAEEYRREYFREIEKQSMWDKLYLRQPLTAPVKIFNHKCYCNTITEVSCQDDRDEYRSVYSYGGFAGRPVKMRLEYDYFYCPVCGENIKVAGKIIDIRVNMVERKINDR